MKHTHAQTQALDKAVLEVLEDRRLMSTVSFTDGILTLQGNEDSANNLTVKQTGDTVWTIINGTTRSYQRSQVRDIRVVGGQQNDVVYIDSTIRAHIETKAGNDTVITGDGNDTVYSGDGNDVVDTRGGNDLVILGEGNDRVYAGDGNDVIDGFGGNDTAYAGRGNDKVFGGDGDDLLDGKEGNDTLIAGRGNDRMYGNTGANTFDGKEGPDTIYSDSATDTVLGQTPEDTVVRPTTTNTANQNNTPPVSPTPAEEPAGDDTSNSGNTGNTGNTGTDDNTNNTGGDNTGTDSSNTAQDNTGEPGAPVSVIRAISSTVPAGHAIHVHGIDSTLTSGTMLDAKYEWDFGDAGSKHNKLVGFNAAHVYDKAGTYTVTLRVTNKAGKTSVAKLQVNITAANRRMIYVDRNGNDANNGATQGSAVRSFARAMQLAGDNTEIVFRRGQTFELTGGAALSYQNVVIGAYGDGANPVLMRTGTRNGGNFFTTSATRTKNFTVENLTFDSIWNNDSNPDGMPQAVQAGGQNVTVRDSQFLNVGYVVNGNQNPQGVLIQDNTAPLKAGLREYLAWVEGTDYVILGNTVANSTRQHIVRAASGYERILIADNDFSNIAQGRSGDWADSAKTTVVLQDGKYGYVAGNDLRNGPAVFGPLGSADVFKVDGPDGQIRHPNYATERTAWIVFENNKVEKAALALNNGTEHMMARNNVIDYDGKVSIEIDGYSGTFQRKVSDVYILNNTAINDGIIGSFLSLGGGSEGISVNNNLYVAPQLTTGANLTAVIYVRGNNLDGFREINNNIWPVAKTLGYAEGGYFYVWPSWSDSRGYLTPTEWSAYAQTGQDLYQNVTLPGSVYQINQGGVTAGAKLAA